VRWNRAWFLTRTIQSERGLESANHPQERKWRSSSIAHISALENVLDTADTVTRGMFHQLNAHSVPSSKLIFSNRIVTRFLRVLTHQPSSKP